MSECQRLDKLLSNSGFGSRTDVKKLIRNGLVSIDGKIATSPEIKVSPDKSLIQIDGTKLNYCEFIYLMMNKPAGIISATFDSKKKTCLDLLPENIKVKEPFPAGRLDIDTEGLLLITNDGKLAHNLLSPKKHVDKKYFAKIEGVVGNNDILAFEEGVVIDDGYKTLPAKLRILECSEQISQVEIIIREGKFHQIKRMFEALDKKVVYLKRLEMGSLILDPNLDHGEYRELLQSEIDELYRLND